MKYIFWQMCACVSCGKFIISLSSFYFQERVGFYLERKMNFHEDIIGLYLWLIFRDVVRSYGNNDGDLGPIWIQVLKISTSTFSPF